MNENTNTFAQVRAFLDRSLQAEREEREAKERARREKLRWLAGGFITTLLLLALAGWQWREAEEQKARAEVARQEADKSKTEAQRNQSYSLAALAQMETDKGNAVNGILLALEGLPKNLKEPERPYVARVEEKLYAAAMAQRERAVLRHEGNVSAAVFSPDGKVLATASDDHAARLWDAATGKLLAVLRGHEGGISSIAFSPDGKRLATASNDKTARLWDLTECQAVAWQAQAKACTPKNRVLRGHEESITTIAFSPDGTRLVTGSWDGTARLWDAVSSEEESVLLGNGCNEDVDCLTTAAITVIAFSPDGARLATASRDNAARLWEVDTVSQVKFF